MNSNELIEHIRRLNAIEALETQQRREKALNKIKKLREQLKEKRNGIDIHQRVCGREEQKDCSGL